MNLYLFPAPANDQGGYNIAVKQALEDSRIKLNEDDVVIWIAKDCDENCYYKSTNITFPPTKLLSLIALYKILNNRFTQELSCSKLKIIQNEKFNSIHCDDVIFYRAIRKLYPNQKITVRFHNVFARIRERERVLSVKQDLRFEKKMKILAQLEFEILNDKNVHKIFLSDEDRFYYTSMTGRANDSEVWHIEPEVKIEENNSTKTSNKLVWFGGVEGHKTSSVKWFITDVLPKVKLEIPDIEFHLWGNCTEQFNHPEEHVFGHGRYMHNDLPMKEQALFVNPDVIGGGVKIKLLTYFKEAVPFITTPFGFEGYNAKLKKLNNCHVVEMDHWPEAIISILNRK